MAVKPIPDGYHTVTPYLTIKDVDLLIDFLTKSFNAHIAERMKNKDGQTIHSEIILGDSKVMAGRARSETEIMPGMIYLYTEDCDGLYKKALENGAVKIMEPADQVYGDRNAGVKDPLGNVWWLATHIKDVTPEEAEKLMNERL